MDIANPHFAEPHWLWLTLVLLVALAWLQRHAAVARRRQLGRIATTHSIAELTRSHSPLRRRLKEILLLAAVGLMGLALARPQWGEMESRRQPFSEDLVFVLDCSRSMLATDVQPDRLSRAKSSISRFVQRYGKGRVGLVAFAGGAFLQCPLTFDYQAFEESLMSLDARSIPVGGTDIGHALREAYLSMEKKSFRKLVMLLTDGEDLEKNGVKAAESLAKEGVVVFTIGVGTPAGEEIRAAGPDGRVELVRDSKGQVVHSRLDETTLRAIANATGGEYQPLGRIGEGMAKLRHDIESSGTVGVIGRQVQGVDRFYVPVAIALLLLICESLLGTCRKESPPLIRTTGKTGGVSAMLLLVVLGLGQAVAATTNESTNVVAVAEPEPEPKDARGFYNAGSRKLAAGKLDEAERMFQSALDQQEDAVQPGAIYNIGCVRFDQGANELKKETEKENTQAEDEQVVETAAVAVQTAEEALAGDDMSSLVAAYQRGRGVRRELSAAFKALRRALETYRRTLEKWQRSLNDFRGSAELNLPGTNAVHNAEVVEREIAKLVDKERQKQMMAMQMAHLGSQLQGKMKQLKGRIPKDQLASCKSGEEGGESGEGGDEESEDSDEVVFEELKGVREVGIQEGSDRELSLSPEQVGRLLDQFSPANRRLPMGFQEEKKPREPNLRNW